jgi:hypothetical protein
MEVIRNYIKFNMAKEKVVEILRKTVEARIQERKKYYATSLYELSEFNIITFIPEKKEFEEILEHVKIEIAKKNSRLKEISKENKKIMDFFKCLSNSINSSLTDIDEMKNDHHLLALIDKIEYKFRNLLAKSTIQYTSSEDSSDISNVNVSGWLDSNL